MIALKTFDEINFDEVSVDAKQAIAIFLHYYEEEMERYHYHPYEDIRPHALYSALYCIQHYHAFVQNSGAKMDGMEIKDDGF